MSLENLGTNKIMLTVRDSGCGIPQASLEKIFKPFYTTKATDKGTGLGLVMVKEAVADVDGHIEVKSVVNEGSVFTVTMPLVENQETGYVESSTVTEDSGSLNIMLVDDDEAILEVSEAMLSHLGHDN